MISVGLTNIPITDEDYYCEALMRKAGLEYKIKELTDEEIEDIMEDYLCPQWDSEYYRLKRVLASRRARYKMIFGNLGD